MPPAHDDVLDSALACAARLTGMEGVVLFGFRGDEARFERVRAGAGWPGLVEGSAVRREDTLCARMLAGESPRASAHTEIDFADAPLRTTLGIGSYAGAVVQDRSGQVLGTLTTIDRGHVPVPDAAVGVLDGLASIVALRLAAPAEVVIRRTPSGWLVGDEEAPCLTSAMVLADLLSDDLDPPGRPPKPAEDATEADRLRTAVSQLEHALAARVLVEQAIGVLAERLGCPPREGFELLRKVARRQGSRVHDLSRAVVSSVGDRSVALPAELARPARPGPR